MSNGRDIQSDYLQELKDQKVSVAVFLVSGIKLCGFVTGFDQFVVHLHHDSNDQMIFKHAISTIMPNKDVMTGKH
jgi:host factor-I protein